MTTLGFHARAPYLHEMLGQRGSSPTVYLMLTHDDAPGRGSVGSRAVLDSGCERSVFDGSLAVYLGLDLASGSPCTLQTSAGSVSAYLHVVNVSLDMSSLLDVSDDTPELGDPSRMRVALTLNPLRRNLLGRDFFERFRVCFDELAQSVYLGVRRRTEEQPRPAQRAA